MRHVIRAGFDRRYVFLPLLAAVALVVTAFFVGEARRSYSAQLSVAILDRQDRMRQVAELIYACMESESAQRGYLLTGERQYAQPYERARGNAQLLIATLLQRYAVQDAAELPALRNVEKSIRSKVAEMDQTLAMMNEGRARDALSYVKTDVGLHRMSNIRMALEQLRTRERQRIYDGIAIWTDSVRVNRIINAASTVLNLLLLVAVGLLATREIRRRAETNLELEQLVSQRTEELRDLSVHLLRVGEREKAALARELHDELGGLLVAMRMDLSQLRRRVVLPDADAELRWARVDASLMDGIALKRRVIEELRPTLLDNMGLLAALRWQAEQSCAVGGLQLDISLPEEEPSLPPEAAIAVFRAVQESLANTLKHARATRVRLAMQRGADTLQFIIEDDGVGLPVGAATRPGSHGLKQLVFRMNAVGGELRIEAVLPHGTRTVLTVRC